MMWNWNYPYNYFGAGWIIQPIFSLFIAIFVIFLIFRLFGKHKRHDFFKSEEPIDILKKRYANGEIDKKEFEEKKKDLS